jgi:hypothetical protein
MRTGDLPWPTDQAHPYFLLSFFSYVKNLCHMTCCVPKEFDLCCLVTVDGKTNPTYTLSLMSQPSVGIEGRDLIKCRRRLKCFGVHLIFSDDLEDPTMKRSPGYLGGSSRLPGA